MANKVIVRHECLTSIDSVRFLGGAGGELIKKRIIVYIVGDGRSRQLEYGRRCRRMRRLPARQRSEVPFTYRVAKGMTEHLQASRRR
jgi:hypothetical protein